MNENKDIELIEQYLLGFLDKESKMAFEQEMNEDVELKKAVELHKELLSGIETFGDEELASSIESIEHKLSNEEYFDQFEDSSKKKGNSASDISENHQPGKSAIVRTMWNKRNLAIAAAILALIAASVALFKPSGSNFDKIFADNYELNEALLDQQIIELSELGFATEDKDQKESLKAMLQAYQQCKDLPCRNSLVTQHLRIFPTDPIARMYKATNLMEQKNYSAAVFLLNDLQGIPDTKLQTEIAWYLALCYLKFENKRPEAQRLFQKIAEEKGSKYSEKARNILQKIEK